jgi:hypothetical protein
MPNTDTNRTLLRQLLFFAVIIVALLFIMSFPFSSEAHAQAVWRADRFEHGEDAFNDRDCNQRLQERAERMYLKQRDTLSLSRFTGDFELVENETQDGNLVVSEGDAVIAGKVTGAVLVICGNVKLRETAVVEGDVVCIGGHVAREPGSQVLGDQIEASPRSLAQTPRTRREWSRSWKSYRRRYAPSFEGMAHYNRVDGTFLGISLPRRYTEKTGFEVFGFGGHAFASKKWQYQIGGELYRGEDWRTLVGLEAHDQTASEDEWIISTDENSLAAFFINEDFRDYFRREGFSAYVSQQLSENAKLTAGYRRDNLFSLPNETDWSLFVNRKRFRVNPLIAEGRLASYFAQGEWDTRNHREHPDRGWRIQIDAETSRPSLESAYDFDRVIVDLRRYQPIGEGKNFDLRLRAGSVRGFAPEQFLFDLGGISTLQALRFKELTGDRMLLGNLEYRIDASRSRLGDIPLLGELNLILFADAGLAWFAADKTSLAASFDYFTFDKLKTDVGIGLTDEDGEVRLNFAKRTDRGGEDVVISFRVERSF